RLVAFNRQRPTNFVPFDGLRHKLGWVGCGLSYKFLCDSALKHGRNRLLVCEDDVSFPPNYAERKAIIDEYLDLQAGTWDVFSGFMADVAEDTVIHKIETFQGQQFIWMDRAISTVYNIYSSRALSLLAEWDPAYQDINTNTIDRYMQGRPLRVVTAYPFLV